MRSNNRRSSLPKELQALHIEKLSHEGRGIAHHEGKVVFVDGALPGEDVLARFKTNKGSYAEAVCEQITAAAPERVVPACPFFSLCGGCSLQHYASASQLSFKEGMLHERLQHAIPASEYEKLPALSSATFGYRRKARLAVRYVSKKSKALVGFREQHSSFITDMDSCLVLDAAVSQILPALSLLISGLDSNQHLPQVEVAVGDVLPGSFSCALIFRHLQNLTQKDIDALTLFGQEHLMDIYLQPKGPESAHKLFPSNTLERLYYQLPEFKLELAFHPTDFTQVNAGINRLMVSKAIALLELIPNDKVLDLFCGLGNFTLPIATVAAHVTGVEGSTAMVERGNENAARNNITNATFLCADLTLPPSQHSWLQQGFDKVLLDPPRSGALEVLPAVIAARPSRIVYVSCNPATLARDAAVLVAQGYILQAAGAMDMFPQTSHVEAMALFILDPKQRSR
ncbi:MAG: 23S rRNA (uracil(1939)-C(5))-methyltransferase RlmD [Pseudomonadota bacterium]